MGTRAIDSLVAHLLRPNRRFSISSCRASTRRRRSTTEASRRRVHARVLFDGMPPGKMRKKEPVASFGGIDALPDGVLEHILGFVQAEEAVRTCVLARRWRHLWKSATGLRITCDAGNLEQVNFQKNPLEFVDHLLCLRGHAPLETFELRFSHFHDRDNTLRLNRWFRHVLVGQVQMLRLENIGHDGFELDYLPLFSQHLTKIELVGIDLNDSFCDFSGCPSLEHLEIDTCYLLGAREISSESLKRLSMTNSHFHP
ncbi:hypothetical protein ACP70R_045281 [Stipagrostis hirtigluma subsp. patula]